MKQTYPFLFTTMASLKVTTELLSHAKHLAYEYDDDYAKLDVESLLHQLASKDRTPVIVMLLDILNAAHAMQADTLHLYHDRLNLISAEPCDL